MTNTAIAPVHSNFSLAFTRGHVFTKDEDTTYEVNVLNLGDLKIHSGKIMACDPGIFSPDEAERYAFVRRVPNGEHPVYVSKVALSETHHRIAALKVQFSSEHVVKWEMALRQGQRMEDLKPGQFFGYGVDCGIGCVADPATFANLGDDDYTEETTETLFERMDENDGDWGSLTFADGNLIAAHSGWGDGTYPSYFGLDEKGEPVCFITDFEVLVAPIYEDIAIKNIPSLFGKKIESAALKQADSQITVKSVAGKPDSALFEIVGEAASSLDIDYYKTEGVAGSSVSYGGGGKDLEIDFNQPIATIEMVLHFASGMRALE